MYNPISGAASRVCVNGSVDGVRTAAAMVAPTTTYRHCESIISDVTTPVCPRSSWITGTCKEGEKRNNVKSSSETKPLPDYAETCAQYSTVDKFVSDNSWAWKANSQQCPSHRFTTAG